MTFYCYCRRQHHKEARQPTAAHAKSPGDVCLEQNKWPPQVSSISSIWPIYLVCSKHGSPIPSRRTKEHRQGPSRVIHSCPCPSEWRRTLSLSFGALCCLCRRHETILLRPCTSQTSLLRLTPLTQAFLGRSYED